MASYREQAPITVRPDKAEKIIITAAERNTGKYVEGSAPLSAKANVPYKITINRARIREYYNKGLRETAAGAPDGIVKQPIDPATGAPEGLSCNCNVNNCQCSITNFPDNFERLVVLGASVNALLRQMTDLHSSSDTAITEAFTQANASIDAMDGEITNSQTQLSAAETLIDKQGGKLDDVYDTTQLWDNTNKRFTVVSGFAFCFTLGSPGILSYSLPLGSPNLISKGPTLLPCLKIAIKSISYYLTIPYLHLLS